MMVFGVSPFKISRITRCNNKTHHTRDLEMDFRGNVCGREDEGGGVGGRERWLRTKSKKQKIIQFMNVLK